MGKVVEFGARLAGDREKLSARFNEVTNIIVEASYWAGVEGSGTVSASHVEKADSERVYRNSKLSDGARLHKGRYAYGRHRWKDGCR
ncbi:MAG: AAA family ATPase [Deltaproteobacteria bacterium]|nr:AAA family ATPase [Deltaproteobacteria bacterium]